MHPFEWSTDDFVYVSQLDADHQQLFEHLEHIRQAVAAGQPPSQVGFLLWRFSKRFSVHISSEERLMRNSRYPAHQWHERQHHAGRTKMARLTRAAHGSDEFRIREGLEDLARWMQDHVRLADRMFAAHLRNDQRGRLAS